MSTVSSSVFAHLAVRFGARPEDLATEALLYVLSRSLPARQALLRFVGQTGVTLPSDLLFRSQVSGEDDARPDLVGIDTKGEQRLIIEAKFWAGLTANQPVTYLQRLPKQDESLLLFMAPARRLSLLASELPRRCGEGSAVVEDAPGADPNIAPGG